MADCAHKHMKFDLSAQTSLMNVSFHVFGVHCEDCDRKWDVGELLQAITKIAKLEAVVEAIRPLDIQGAESWAQAIVDEWKRGERDYSAMKVAEKLLVVLPDLHVALTALETQDDNAN